MHRGDLRKFSGGKILGDFLALIDIFPEQKGFLHFPFSFHIWWESYLPSFTIDGKHQWALKSLPKFL